MESMNLSDLPFDRWKGTEIISMQYLPHENRYILFLDDGGEVRVNEEFMHTGEGKARATYKEIAGVSKEEFDKTKEEYERTIKSLTKTFEEKLNHERDLRAKDQERIKYLQDKVFEYGRKLQRWDEQNRGYTSTSIKPFTYESVFPNPLSEVPGDSSSSTLSPGRAYPSSSGGSTSNDPVQLLRKWLDP